MLLGFSAMCAGLLAGCSSEPEKPFNAAAGSFSSPAPVSDPVIAVDPWTYNGKPGKNIRTANYSIYTTETNPSLIGRLPTFVEAALKQYTTVLGTLPSPSGPMETFVMSKRGEWERLTKQLMGAQAELYLRIPRGGFAAEGRGLYYTIGAADTLSIAAHEGWHQYTQRTFRQPLPTWLEEGIATFMEGYRWDGMAPRFLGWSNTERFDQLRAAASTGKLMPLEQVLSTSPQELLGDEGQSKAKMGGMFAPDDASDSTDRLLTYYAQIWALIHFVREGEGGKYKDALQRLVADAAHGSLRAQLISVLGEEAARSTLLMRRGPAAVVAYFNKDVDAFSAEYARFVDQVVKTGSRSAVVEGRSPLKASSEPEKK